MKQVHEACTKRPADVKDPLLHSIKVFFHKKWAVASVKLKKSGKIRSTYTKECDAKSIIRVRSLIYCDAREFLSYYCVRKLFYAASGRKVTLCGVILRCTGLAVALKCAGM